MAEKQDGEQNQPRRPRVIDYVLTGIIFAASYMAAGGKPSSNQSNDQADTNQQIANWTAAVAKYTKRLSLWTFGLLVVGIITAGTLAVQTYTLINQLGEMRTEQRPWITFTLVAGSDLTHDKNGSPPRLIATTIIKNIGHTPALHVFVLAKLLPWASVDVLDSSRDTLCATLKNRTITVANQGFLLFPNDVKQPQLPFEMTVKDFNDWSFTGGSLVIVGCLDYVASADVSHHHVGFIVEVDKKGQSPSSPIEAIGPTENVPKDNLLYEENPTLPWDIN